MVPSQIWHLKMVHWFYDSSDLNSDFIVTLETTAFYLKPAVLCWMLYKNHIHTNSDLKIVFLAWVDSK